jgi:hypothetical protein
VIDSASDAPIDTPVDAAVDAPPDVVLVDAPLGEPRCTSGPTTLVDTSPRRITMIANVGNVLYVAAYDPSVTTDGEVLALDPATGAAVASPLMLSTSGAVWGASDAAYATEGTTNGSIWRLVPGLNPVELITGRPTPTVVTSDGAYVYWSEKNPTANQPELIKRRAIAGGAIEQVMTGCALPYRIVVDATDLYCVEFQSGTVLRAPKDGSAGATTVPYSGTIGGGYPVATLIQDGASLYLANFYNNPQIWGATKPSGPFTLIKQNPDIGRYLGLAATPQHFYASNAEGMIDQVDRTTHSLVPIQIMNNVDHGAPSGDPIIWNGQLYVVADNYTQAGNRLVLHCID